MAWIALALAGLAAAGVVGWYVNATNVETPKYAVERVEGPFEIRRYPAMVAAEVMRPGDRQDAVRAAFSPLARYIFGKERGGADKIAMTAPVTQTPETIAMTAPVTQSPESDAWRVRFLMPAGATRDALPEPGGDVRLTDLPPARIAAVRFSGRWTDANFAAELRKLEAWLAAQGIAPSGPPTYAYYNDPFTPAFLRRNEVLLPLPD